MWAWASVPALSDEFSLAGRALHTRMHCRRPLQPRAVSRCYRLLLVCQGGQRQAATRHLCKVVNQFVTVVDLISISFFLFFVLSSSIASLPFLPLLSPDGTWLVYRGTQIQLSTDAQKHFILIIQFYTNYCLYSPGSFPLKATHGTNQNKLRLDGFVLEGFYQRCWCSVLEVFMWWFVFGSLVWEKLPEA